MSQTTRRMGDEGRTLGVHLCWHCQQETTPSPFCDHCLKVQPLGPKTDYFTFMGLPRNPKIDLKGLEEIFHHLSRKLHPDFYQGKGERERALSLGNSAILNKAYRTLRDPIRRAEYLIQLEAGANIVAGDQPPQELFEEILEYQERIEELRGLSPEEEGRREELTAGLKKVKDQFQRKEGALFQDLEVLFERWDEKAGEARGALLEEMRRFLSQRNYIRNVIQDIEEALAPEEASP